MGLDILVLSNVGLDILMLSNGIILVLIIRIVKRGNVKTMLNAYEIL